MDSSNMLSKDTTCFFLFFFLSSSNLLELFVLFSLFVTLITISTGNRLGSVTIPDLKGLPVLGSMLSLSHGLTHRSRAGLNKQLMAFSWCIMMMVVMVAVVPSSAVVEDKEIDGKIQGYTNVTFELKYGVTGYSSFLTRLRNAVEAPIRVCGLQSTRSTPILGAEYIYVTLKINNTAWVTLGMDVKDMYVWGYQDNVKYNGQYRATFLDDAPSNAKDNLFRGSTTRTTRFGGNYRSLEPAAGVSRLNLVLGIPNLEGAIRAVYGKQEGQLNQGNAEAKFFLIAIQMVAEASRFRFMEEAIVRNNNTPDIKKKMVAFQNDWGTISSSIHKAEAAKPKCTNITPTLVISTTDYRQEVNKVDEIKSDMGLLKY